MYFIVLEKGIFLETQNLHITSGLDPKERDRLMGHPK
jgi:hypothetical protein